MIINNSGGNPPKNKKKNKQKKQQKKPKKKQTKQKTKTNKKQTNKKTNTPPLNPPPKKNNNNNTTFSLRTGFKLGVKWHSHTDILTIPIGQIQNCNYATSLKNLVILNPTQSLTGCDTRVSV